MLHFTLSSSYVFKIQYNYQTALNWRPIIDTSIHLYIWQSTGQYICKQVHQISCRCIMYGWNDKKFFKKIPDPDRDLNQH